MLPSQTFVWLGVLKYVKKGMCMNLARFVAMTEIMVRGHILNWPWRSRVHRRVVRSDVISKVIPKYFKRYLKEF